MKKKIGWMLILTIFVFLVSTGCDDKIGRENEADSNGYAVSQAGQSASGSLAGGENPDKDGPDVVEIYATGCDRLQDRRSYDDGVTAAAAQGIENIVKDINFTSIEDEEYWDYRGAQQGERTAYEVCSLDLEYNGRIYVFNLYSDGTMFRYVLYEGAEMVNRVTRYDLNAEQMEQVLQYLEEISENIPLMSAPQ